MKNILNHYLLVAALCISLSAAGQPTAITEVPLSTTGFTSIGGLVYFSEFPYLYRTDGTEEGTIQLANAPGARYFFMFNGEVYFLTSGPRETTELWKSDGTPEGTYPLAAFFELSILGQTEDYIYFAGALDETGRELYRTNGEPGGTVLVKDINPGSGDGISDKGRFFSSAAGGFLYYAAVLDNNLIFAADDGVVGSEIWITDGTTEGTTLLKDVNPGVADGFAAVRPVSFNGHVYFSGIDARGAELWRTDGTPAGTVFFRGVIPGSEGSVIQFAPDHNGILYFTSTFVDDFGLKTDLWKVAETATKVKTLCYECRFDGSFVDFNNKLTFGVHREYGYSLIWATNGVSTGTNEIFSDFTDGSIPFMEKVNDRLLFYTMVQGHASDFNRNDGNTTTRFWTFRSGGMFASINMAKVGDYVYFADHAGPADYGGQAIDPEDHLQLIRTDGDSVVAFRDLFGMSFTNTANITDYDGKLFFTTITDGSLTLWIYDPEATPSASFTLVNADTDEDIMALVDGDTIVRPANLNINIRYNPADNPANVLFKHQGKNVRRESQAPFSIGGDNNGNYLAWAAATPGHHTVEAIPFSSTGEAGTGLTIHFFIQVQDTACSASGVMSYEKWNGVSGTAVNLIPLNSEPSESTTLTSFEAPMNQGFNYGARLSGYLCPPTSGNYTFWIASNDHSELWLSSDDNPDNSVRIAWLTRATDPRQWDRFATQRSAPVWLEAGQRYYVAALHKQGVGGDHVAVGWELPDGTLERPIDGSRLSPFVAPAAVLASNGRLSENGNQSMDIQVYPNPVHANTPELTIGGYEGVGPVDVEIVSMTGDIVYAERVLCEGDCSSRVLKMKSQLLPGVYIVRLKTKSSSRLGRLAVK